MVLKKLLKKIVDFEQLIQNNYVHFKDQIYRKVTTNSAVFSYPFSHPK